MIIDHVLIIFSIGIIDFFFLPLFLSLFRFSVSLSHVFSFIYFLFFYFFIVIEYKAGEYVCLSLTLQDWFV